MSYQNNKKIEARTIISILVIFYLLLPFIGWAQGAQLEKLIKDLKDENSVVRTEAALALGDKKDARAVEPLIAVLKDKDENQDVRGAAVLALAAIKDRRAVEPLIAVLKDKDEEWIFRVTAASVLGKIKSARAVEPLIAVLKDKDEDLFIGAVRASAVTALGEIKDVRAVESLIVALKDGNRTVRAGAAKALGEIKDARAVESLIEALKDENSFVRWCAAGALDLIGGVKAQEALSLFLKDINLKEVAKDYKSFIGEADTEGLLLFVLQRYGNETMAEDFFYSGNQKLKEAAERWAKRHSYSIPSDREGPLRRKSSEKSFPKRPVARLGKGRISAVALTPDCQLLAVASSIGVWLYNPVELLTGNLTELGLLSGNMDRVISMAFSPDGKFLASGSWDNTIRLWDVAEQKEVAVLKGHTDAVTSVSFSPDGKLLALGSSVVRLWDVVEREEVAVLKGHIRGVESVSFSPDGQWLASGSSDGTVLLWRIKELDESDNDLFPLYGVSLGQTTIEELAKLGVRARIINPETGEPFEYYVVHGMNFWYYDNNVAKGIYITRSDPIPNKWQALGFDWDNSYNEWVNLLNKLGYIVQIIKSPKAVGYDGHDSFSAEIEASKRAKIPIRINLDFGYSEGTTADSKGTLYSISIKGESE